MSPGAEAARRGSRPAASLSRAELQAAEAVGSLMELWGFRRQLGRIWTVLFLSERPLAAPELCERLQISTGLLSMSLAELRRWGVVKGATVPGDRKEHFEAETHVWRLVRRVLAERERRAVEGALAVVESALAELRGAIAESAGDPRVRAMARFRMERLEELANLCRVGLSLLKALIDGSRADVSPLRALSEALSRRS
ncbi:MAG: ArsR family transcriptional regulator [Deltaproteobacteria bacterium]|nr:ArsR family transcriptional regulator [Deltaproteobacteria bacterium]